MIVIDPVLETYIVAGFTAWPTASQPAGHLLPLSGQLDPASVGTGIAVIASYGFPDSDDPSAPALIQHVISSECLIAPGGLRIRDTGTGVTVNRGCCCGLENWRDWQNLPGEETPWLGHDPSPWIEHLGQNIRVWPDGGFRETCAGATPIEITTSQLPGLIDTAHRQLREFLDLIEPWAVALGQPGARELAPAIDRHFHITGGVSAARPSPPSMTPPWTP